ncbi:MAG TPA: helix-turn-helix transcriptional regulator [Sedimentibacter sp.]|jgi:transcriptional regulator with XRE-family HTH domain|nr:helix-turn-helix transcriptional regulator [Sedimentibacter sp.]
MKDIRERNEDTAGYRISELRKDRDWNQKELAEKLYVSPSQISRIESGETESVNIGILISAAKLFHVSTDYLLGLTQITTPKSYDISELSLSEKSIRRLMFGTIDQDILNRLLEHDLFPTLCKYIRYYFDDTIANGIMGRNEIIDLATGSLTDLAKEDPARKAEINEDKSFLKSQKIGVHEADIEKIKNIFMQILRDIKGTINVPQSTGAIATAEAVQGIRDALPDKPDSELNADDVSGAIATYVGKVLPMDNGTSDLLKQLAKQMLEQSLPDNTEGSDE